MALCLPVHSAFAAEAADRFGAWPKATDRELAELRGGFITADGLNISIGLSQVTMIGGEIKAQRSIDLSDLGRTNGDASTAGQDKTVQLIQNGDGNSVTPDVPANYGGRGLTVIQNSLDEQTIQNVNMLKIDVSGVSQLRSAAMGASMGLQMIRSLR